jgi:hypothetical protein
VSAAVEWKLKLLKESNMAFRRWLFVVLGVISAPYLLNASSVRLINNSPYDLRSVIRGADGSYLGEVVVQSQKETVWTDTYGNYGTYGGANSSANQSSRSKTPYTVLWYCMDGADYAVCDTVSTGAVVTAQGCMGARMCKPKKKENYPSQPQGQYLYEEPTTPPLDQ